MMRLVLFSGAVAAFFFAGTPAFADQAGDLTVVADTLWVMIAAFLVFFMNAGFAMVETGFCRSKNAVNILTKNFIVFAIASIAYWAVGFALMFGNGSPYCGYFGFLLHGMDNSPATGGAYQGIFSSLNWTGVPLYAKFFFQLVFAGTAATIVSGAVAERIRFHAFIAFSFLLVAIIYPISGHWIWGGGFLAKLGFYDFAGSTVVHSIGGWAALVGALMLGPRIGKYKKDGSVSPIPGHNMSIATLGALILWLGWFGFNPGSTMAADVNAIARIALVTNLAAAGGILAATFVAWLKIGTPDLSMIINGGLAGLVAITAPCAYVSPTSAVIIGLIAGTIVVVAVIGFDKFHIDDPVGAISVHLVNGVFGTIAVGLFAEDVWSPGTTGNGLFFGGGAGLLWAQLQGVFWVGLFAVTASAICWLFVKALVGLRVEPEEEFDGLDLSEMGMEAYPQDVSRREDHIAVREEMLLAAQRKVEQASQANPGPIEKSEAKAEEGETTSVSTRKD
jgi:Amt family ammonium transporter